MNMSASLLSQIERGIVCPSISTLRRIANYLGTYVGVLLGERISKENAKVIRKNEKIHSVIWGKGVKLYILTPGNPNIEFIYNEYEVASSTGDKLYQHEGEECAYVIEGKLEIDLNGKKFILNNGDFI